MKIKIRQRRIKGKGNAIANRLEGIQQSIGVTSREMAQLLATTPETVSRWRAGKTQPQPRLRDRLLQLGWLANELGELYLPEEARLWIFSPHKMIEGKRPADRIRAGDIESVLRIIAQLSDGAYV